MINFSPSLVHNLLSILRAMESDARSKDFIARRTGDISHALNWSTANDREQSKVIASTLANSFNSFYSQTAWDRFDRFAAQCSSKLSWSDFRAELSALVETIESELSAHYFFHYDPRKAEMVNAFDLHWKPIAEAFPDALFDAIAAVDCYAMQHATASVFHSMRVAEHGLRALAKERKIKLARNKPIEWATWSDLLRKLRDEVEIIERTRPAGRVKDRALGFYSGSVADLESFKNEYRNLVMHVRANYDEHQAVGAILRVNTFMKRLVDARVDQRHYRIRWGFR